MRYMAHCYIPKSPTRRPATNTDPKMVKGPAQKPIAELPSEQVAPESDLATYLASLSVSETSDAEAADTDLPPVAEEKSPGPYPHRDTKSTTNELKRAPLKAPRPDQPFSELLPQEVHRVKPRSFWASCKYDHLPVAYYRELQPDGSWRLYQRDPRIANLDRMDAELEAYKFEKRKRKREKEKKKEEERRKREERKLEEKLEKEAKRNLMEGIMQRRHGGGSFRTEAGSSNAPVPRAGSSRAKPAPKPAHPPALLPASRLRISQTPMRYSSDLTAIRSGTSTDRGGHRHIDGGACLLG